LDALRRAVVQFKNIEGAEALTQEMTRLFKGFHLDGVADSLPPVAALSVYQEFRELTPPGKEGDRVINKLVDRLVMADLLEEAVELMNYQIKFRASGERKAAAGARLAQILLMDRNPENAIKALHKSRIRKIPEKLAAWRRLLEVQAVAELGKTTEALKMLAKDFSLDADKLRAGILWRAKRWPEAARVLARLTGGLDAENLDDDAAALLLKRAVALALNNDTEGLEFLRDRFGAAMSKSKRAAEFHAMIGKKALETEDFALLARRAGELDIFTSFLKRRQVATGTKSAIN
jgi:tetratricopeptide (TPR) repeat protein